MNMTEIYPGIGTIDRRYVRGEGGAATRLKNGLVEYDPEDYEDFHTTAGNLLRYSEDHTLRNQLGNAMFYNGMNVSVNQIERMNIADVLNLNYNSNWGGEILDRIRDEEDEVYIGSGPSILTTVFI